MLDTYVRGPVCHSHGIRGYATQPATKVMLLGISPGSDETRSGVPMSGPSGKLLDGILEACGWHRDKCYATNIVCFQTDGAPTFSQVMECRPRLEQEVEQIKPALIILLGNPVTELFFPDKKPGSVRGGLVKYEPWNTYLLPTYHPAAILRTGSEFITRDIVRDFQKIPDFFGMPPRPHVAWTVVSDLATAQYVLDSLPRNRLISLDVETPMKEDDPTASIEDNIKCFAIAFDADDGDITYWFTGDAARVDKLAWPTDVQWGGRNFTFDSISVHTQGGPLLPLTWDGQYSSYCLDERGGQHALKPAAREYEAAGFYEAYDAEKLGKPPKGITKSKTPREYSAWTWNRKLDDAEWASQYNAKDATYALRIHNRSMPKVVAEGMEPVYQQLIEAANVYRQMQLHGVYLNPLHFYTLMKEWVPQLDIKERALQALCESLGGPANINLASPIQMAEFLFGTLRLPAPQKVGKSGRPSVDQEVLEALEDTHAFINGVIDLRHLEKAVNTYLLNPWQNRKRTGRVHPAPLLHGVVSNRLAYNNPAINTTPKGYNENPYLQRLRWLYTATDEDHVLIELDYRQAEVFMAWQYSQDPTMWADLQSGDFHRQSAAFIWGIEPSQVSKEQRSDAKRITFGQMFLIGADKLARQSNREKRRDAERTGASFNDPMTPVQASSYIRQWNKRYLQYGKYVDASFEEARTTGELVSLDGRKRRFPIVLDDSIKTQTTNWKIQTTAHACLMSSIIEMFPILTSCYDAWPLIDIHDAVLIEAPKANALDAARCAADIMSRSRYSGVIGLPVEAKMGYSWLDMKDIDL